MLLLDYQRTKGIQNPGGYILFEHIFITFVTLEVI